MKPIVKAFAVSLALMALLATGCAQRAASGGTPPPGTGHDLVLRIDVAGGFLAPQAQLRQLPMFALYADGRLILPGPQIEIYPGPALPNLQVRTVSAEGLQAIRAAARAAGLVGPDRHYDAIRVADAPTTTFTVVADGTRHITSVQALGIEQPAPDASPEEITARAKLSALQSKLGDLSSWLPAGSLGEESPYRPAELRVYVFAYAPPQDLVPRTVDWPLGSFRDFKPLPDQAGIRCGTVTGKDLDRVLATAGGANELTPWMADGDRWELAFRPLLQDESGCR
jgi:hypothetical protein